MLRGPSPKNVCGLNRKRDRGHERPRHRDTERGAATSTGGREILAAPDAKHALDAQWRYDSPNGVMNFKCLVCYELCDYKNINAVPTGTSVAAGDTCVGER
jgi:hypothetical protein